MVSETYSKRWLGHGIEFVKSYIVHDRYNSWEVRAKYMDGGENGVATFPFSKSLKGEKALAKRLATAHAKDLQAATNKLVKKLK